MASGNSTYTTWIVIVVWTNGWTKFVWISRQYSCHRKSRRTLISRPPWSQAWLQRSEMIPCISYSSINSINPLFRSRDSTPDSLEPTNNRAQQSASRKRPFPGADGDGRIKQEDTTTTTMDTQPIDTIHQASTPLVPARQSLFLSVAWIQFANYSSESSRFHVYGWPQWRRPNSYTQCRTRTTWTTSNSALVFLAISEGTLHPRLHLPLWFLPQTPTFIGCSGKTFGKWMICSYMK